MAERWHDRVTRPHLLVIIVVGCLSAFPAAALFPSRQRTPVNQASNPQTRKLYRIEVEDADEAGLIQQELKIKPEVVRGSILLLFRRRSPQSQIDFLRLLA